MKLLLIKLSSLGDLLHVFPALTALQKVVPNLEVTWVVEQGFAEVPLWHPSVKTVIPAPLRAIKKSGLSVGTLKKIGQLFRALRSERYDYVIDAQGLFKSAILARLAKGLRIGLGKGYSRERVSWLYQHSVAAPHQWHAIARVIALFKVIQPIDVDLTQPDYGLPLWQSNNSQAVLFAHGTTWASKHYPEVLWRELVMQVTQKGFKVLLPHVNVAEQQRAENLMLNQQVEVLPKMSLTDIKKKLYQVEAMISVDTGLSHIAAAIGLPNTTLYGPTDPQKIGTLGLNQRHFAASFECAPCGKRECFHPDRFTEPSPPCFRTIPISEFIKHL